MRAPRMQRAPAGADAPHSDISACYGGDMDRCYNCGQELIEIDNRGERVTGCLTCNLWSAEGKEHWVRLGEEDLRALQELRHKGSR